MYFGLIAFSSLYTWRCESVFEKLPYCFIMKFRHHIFFKIKYNKHSGAKQNTQIFEVRECRLTRSETKSLGLRYEGHNFQVLASSAHPTITHKTLVFLYMKENPKLKSKNC